MDGLKTSRDELHSNGSNRSVPRSDSESIHGSLEKSSREGDGHNKDATKGKISRLQEEIASMKGDNLQEFMQSKENNAKGRDKLSTNASIISPKPSRRRPTKNLDLHQLQISQIPEDDHVGSLKPTSPMAKVSKVQSHPFSREGETADGWSQLTPASSLHGNTSKVVATHNRRKTWDWNNLPRVGTSMLTKHHSFNVINLPIDGEIKQILYSSSYNDNFKAMNIFLSFNMDSKSKDAQLQSKKRLTSFGTYIGHYLRSRLYAYQCFPFYQQEPPLDRTYASYDSSKDYSEIETIISLWYMQGQRCISQSNSVFFSAEVVQHLLQRKANSRNQTPQQTAIYVPQTGANLMTAKPIIPETSDDIDILLLRPHAESKLGWQLAYDEPNLKIADYPLDISPWMMDESDAHFILGSHISQGSSMMVNIVNNEEELVKIANENAGKYLLDCMGRNKENCKDGRESPVTSTHMSASSSVKEDSPVNNSGQESPSATPEPTKKKVSSKLGKKTGLAHLFKRKHTPAASAPSSPQEKSSQVVSDDLGNSIENAWLEGYFSHYLSNYKKVDLPTQFLLPKEAQDTPKVRSPSGNQELPESKKAFLYSKESLQLKLPFADNSIPAIFCPRIWMNLAFNKWRSLLREMYRVLLPGGYAMAAVTDIGVSNSLTQASEESLQEFPTTQERDRVLDAISVAAIEKGLHIYPTQHLAQAFKDVGFTNLKYSVLSLKTGDCSTEMGCLYEIYSEITWDLLFRRHLPDPTKPPKDTEPTTLFRRFVREHMGKVDDNAGSLRILYLVAQKPRKSNI